MSSPPPLVNIRPGVNVLSVLRHLNYKAWFALAEFVDNAVQSYLKHREDLEKLHGEDYKLRVSIQISPQDGGSIIIRDNAAGISSAEYQRAFRAAAVPPDRSGLSEFGMGMKSAACWFSRDWSVRTSALGEPYEGTVVFDINSIINDEIEDLSVVGRSVAADLHYTEVILRNLYKTPQGRTLFKIKEHLSNIYRIFIRDGLLELTFNNEKLSHQLPKILKAPFYKTPDAPPELWLKEVEVAFADGKKVVGFAAIRETGSTSEAGFALFRRRRLIEGSADEGYRPEAIFGRSNSFIYQRVFGELYFYGFGVSHTKDGLQWDEHEEEFLDRLRKQLDEPPLQILTQAREYRMKPRREELVDAVSTALEKTAVTIEKDALFVLDRIEVKPPVEEVAEEFTEAETNSRRIIEVQRRDVTWVITLEATSDPSVGDWIELFDTETKQAGARHLGVRLSLAHPFTERFASADPLALEPLIRIAAALALAETAAREAGAKLAGTVRRNFNELLRETFSKT